MPPKQKSRVALWVRILLIVPLPLVALAVYQSGQNPRTGLFEAATMAADSLSAAQYRLPLPAYLPVADFTLTDTIQLYDSSNLYEKINGHDVALFRFKFVALTFASYSRDGVAYVDVYAYRMNRRENALGVFAGERSGERINLAMRDAGYRSGGALFFYRGPWYVQITPSAVNPEITQAIDELADSLATLLPAPSQPLSQLRWFPEENLIANSEGFFPDNAFATDFLGEVFTAEYEAEGGRAKAFRHQSDSAVSIFDRYTTFLGEAATPVGTMTVNDQDIKRFTAYGEETWITLVDSNLIGLTGVTDSAFAHALMGSLVDVAMHGNEGN